MDTHPLHGTRDAYPSRIDMGPETPTPPGTKDTYPLPPSRRQAKACENITFPQLSFQMVNICSAFHDVRETFGAIQIPILLLRGITSVFLDVSLKISLTLWRFFRWEIVLWLLEEKKMDQEAKDLESGWTALHRALFYGQIATARILMSVSASLY